MPRRCTVCAHPDREAIELAVIRNGSYRAIAVRFGVDRKAIERHHRHHMREPDREPSPADLERQRQAEHRERLRVEKHHVIAGLLAIVEAQPSDPKVTRTWAEIARLEGLYPDARVHHTVEQLDAEDHASIDRLVARFHPGTVAEPTGVDRRPA